MGWKAQNHEKKNCWNALGVKAVGLRKTRIANVHLSGKRCAREYVNPQVLKSLEAKKGKTLTSKKSRSRPDKALGE